MTLKFRTALLALSLIVSVFSTGARAAPSIDSDNIAAVKGIKRVAIERFGIEFYTQLFVSSRSARLGAELSGISESTRQAITQQAWDDTLAALAKAGFEVVPAAQLAEQPIFKTLEAKYGKDVPFMVEEAPPLAGGKQVSLIYAPVGMKTYFAAANGTRGTVGLRMEAQNHGVGQQQAELAKAADVALLDIHVLVSFGATSASTSNLLRSFARLGSQAEIKPMPLLVEGETQLQVVTAAGPRTFSSSPRRAHTAAVYLKEPVVAAENIYTSQLKDNDVRVTASSEDAFKATNQAMIRDAIEAMVQALAAAR